MTNLDVLEELTVSLLSLSGDINLYKETLDILPIGIAIISSRIVTWCNKRTLDLFGYDSVSEVAGMNSRMFYFSREEYERAGKKCYPGGGHTLAKMKKKNGNIVWVFINVHISNEQNGRALVIFCSIGSLRKICGHFGEELRYT